MTLFVKVPIVNTKDEFAYFNVDNICFISERKDGRCVVNFGESVATGATGPVIYMTADELINKIMEASTFKI